MLRKPFIFVALMAAALAVSAQNQDNHPAHHSTHEHALHAEQPLRWSQNYGKSLVILGGSFSCIPASEVSKSYWKEKLNLNITNAGVGGAGFSNLSQGDHKHIQWQVDQLCTPDAPTYDIYLLWASTNDLACKAPIGTPLDYTSYDNYDASKLNTQCGGINYCVKKIYEKNPKAKILFFTSLRGFCFGDKGHNSQYQGGDGMVDLVKGQRACCEMWGIPYLDQFASIQINALNYKQYIENDNLHLTPAGYDFIKYDQMMFIATH